LAIYHFAAQILGRGKGRRNLDGTPRARPDNVVAASAYRAGTRLHDAREGRTQNYSGRQGVAHSEVLLPEGAAAWLADREKLWNEVQRIESRADAQLARELNMALPHELNAEQRLTLVREFVCKQFTSRGMVADIALHEPVVKKGDDPRNFHVHIMLSLRKATKTGLHGVKTREWNSRELLGEWRKAWQDHTNQALERAGKRDRVDHRTLAAQREEALAQGNRKAAYELNREPEIHVGPRPKAMQGRNVEAVSYPRERGAPRWQRPDTQRQQSSSRRQGQQQDWQERGGGDDEPKFHAQARRARRKAYEDRQRAWRKKQAERDGSNEERMARAQERWARQKAYEDRQRAWRMKQAEWNRARAQSGGVSWGLTDKEKAAQREEWLKANGKPERRVRDYPATDRGPRIGRLWDILTGNNLQAKRDLARIDAVSARLTRWLDYQDQKATYWIEGKVGGAAFRRERWQQAQATREQAQRKAAHAKKRASQLQVIVSELRQLAAVLSGRQAAGLRRTRQVEGWARLAGREVARETGRPRGRTR
jgi:hypothetical protein